MRILSDQISKHEFVLRQHPLFGIVRDAHSISVIAEIAKGLTWWPLLFQDVLRLTADYARGSELEHLVEYDQQENAAHDSWYLHDLRALGITPPSLEEAFADEFQPIRDIGFSVIAEVHRPQSTARRVAFLVALQGTGRAFFQEIAATVDRLGQRQRLRYFSRLHLHEETEHSLFVETTKAELDRIKLTESEQVECDEVIERIYRRFADLFSYLVARVESRGTRTRGLGNLPPRKAARGTGTHEGRT